MVPPPESHAPRYAGPEAGGPKDASDLLALFTLEQIRTDTFQAPHPRQGSRWRLYGGQVAAQALLAAGLTAPDGRRPHSLHCYFLRAGHSDAITELRVERVRDGRSFSARRVVASQDGEEIFMASLSFHIDEPGVEHQAAELPDGIVPPEQMPEQPLIGHNTMFEIREFHDPGSLPEQLAFPSRLWARTRGALPDDQLVHSAAIAYLSDMGWAFGGLGAGGGPSIDHAVWFHRPVRADDWLLLALTPIATAGARGVYHGTIHDRAGLLAATLAQETLLRQ
jgi:acyl-CoA thioesterase-2